MTTRYIELKDKELKELVEKKGEIVGKGRKHYQKIMDLSEEATDIARERGEIVNKIIKLTAELIKDKEMGEFELASTTEIHNDVVRVSIIDQIAQFKNNIRTSKDKAIRKENGEQTLEEVIEENKAKVIGAIENIAPEKLGDTLKDILKVLS